LARVDLLVLALPVTRKPQSCKLSLTTH